VLPNKNQGIGEHVERNRKAAPLGAIMNSKRSRSSLRCAIADWGAGIFPAFG